MIWKIMYGIARYANYFWNRYFSAYHRYNTTTNAHTISVARRVVSRDPGSSEIECGPDQRWSGYLKRVTWIYPEAFDSSCILSSLIIVRSRWGYICQTHDSIWYFIKKYIYNTKRNSAFCQNNINMKRYAESKTSN